MLKMFIPFLLLKFTISCHILKLIDFGGNIWLANIVCIYIPAVQRIKIGS